MHELFFPKKIYFLFSNCKKSNQTKNMKARSKSRSQYNAASEHRPPRMPIDIRNRLPDFAERRQYELEQERNRAIEFTRDSMRRKDASKERKTRVKNDVIQAEKFLQGKENLLNTHKFLKRTTYSDLQYLERALTDAEKDYILARKTQKKVLEAEARLHDAEKELRRAYDSGNRPNIHVAEKKMDKASALAQKVQTDYLNEKINNIRSRSDRARAGGGITGWVRSFFGFSSSSKKRSSTRRKKSVSKSSRRRHRSRRLKRSLKK